MSRKILAQDLFFAIHCFDFFFMSANEERARLIHWVKLAWVLRGALVAWFLDLIHTSSLRLHVKIACDG